MRIDIDTNRHSGGGIGTLSAVQIVLIVLKLCKLIDWSWIFVLMPTWIGLGLAAVLVILYLVLKCIVHDH